jgi:hypothetical protein
MMTIDAAAAFLRALLVRAPFVFVAIVRVVSVHAAFLQAVVFPASILDVMVRFSLQCQVREPATTTLPPRRTIGPSA